jgi:hypothetical protein
MRNELRPPGPKQPFRGHLLKSDHGPWPPPFTLNDISVAVWQACPESLGMHGYPFPDNHKVHYILYGSRGRDPTAATLGKAGSAGETRGSVGM